MRGLTKIAWEGDKIQTHKAGYGRTLQLLDRIGQVGRFGENICSEIAIYSSPKNLPKQRLARS